MRTLILAAILLFLTTVSFADQTVRGYIRQDGVIVQPYTRTSPNSTPVDNYNFQGNVNPHTGNIGTDPYRSSPQSPYYNGPQSIPGSVRY